MNCDGCENTTCFYNEQSEDDKSPCETCGEYENCLEQEQGCSTTNCKWVNSVK